MHRAGQRCYIHLAMLIIYIWRCFIIYIYFIIYLYIHLHLLYIYVYFIYRFTLYNYIYIYFIMYICFIIYIYIHTLYCILYYIQSWTAIYIWRCFILMSQLYQISINFGIFLIDCHCNSMFIHQVALARRQRRDLSFFNSSCHHLPACQLPTMKASHSPF